MCIIFLNLCALSQMLLIPKKLYDNGYFQQHRLISISSLSYEQFVCQTKFII